MTSPLHSPIRLVPHATRWALLCLARFSLLFLLALSLSLSLFESKFAGLFHDEATSSWSIGPSMSSPSPSAVSRRSFPFLARSASDWRLAAIHLSPAQDGQGWFRRWAILLWIGHTFRCALQYEVLDTALWAGDKSGLLIF